MELSKLIVSSKTATVEYPGLDGFEVDVAYLTRDELLKLRKKATTNKVSRRGVEEEVDSDLFQDLYIKAVVKGWKGLKFKYLPKLIPVDLSEVEDPEEGELKFSADNAIALMKNSPDFDGWITDIIGDLENFTQNQ